MTNQQVSPLAESFEASTFIPLLNHDNYEIRNYDPFTIRKKKTLYELTDTLCSNGYYYVSLNGKHHLKH